MTDQLTRDQLLQQRLLAATQDCSAVIKVIAELAEQPPLSASDQEQRMSDIEGAIRSIRWNCTRLKEYKG